MARVLALTSGDDETSWGLYHCVFHCLANIIGFVIGPLVEVVEMVVFGGVEGYPGGPRGFFVDESLDDLLIYNPTGVACGLTLFSPLTGVEDCWCCCCKALFSVNCRVGQSSLFVQGWERYQRGPLFKPFVEIGGFPRRQKSVGRRNAWNYPHLRAA